MPGRAHCGLRMLMLDVRNAIASILDRYTLAQTGGDHIAQVAPRDGLIAASGEKPRRVKRRGLMPFIADLVMLIVPQTNAAPKQVIRVGHLSELTARTRRDRPRFDAAQKGWFEQRLGPDVEVQWFVYNAGPSAMEGIRRAQSMSPTSAPIQQFSTRPQGRRAKIFALSRVLAAAGRALVVQPGWAESRRTRIQKEEGRDTAARQHADVAARAWLRSKEYKVTLDRRSLCGPHTNRRRASLCTP